MSASPHEANPFADCANCSIGHPIACLINGECVSCQPVQCDGCGNDFGADELTDGECTACDPVDVDTEPDDHELPALRRWRHHTEG